MLTFRQRIKKDKKTLLSFFSTSRPSFEKLDLISFKVSAEWFLKKL